MHHLTVIVLVVLHLFKFEKTIKKARSTVLAVLHNTTETLVSNIQNKADHLLSHVNRASPADHMFIFKFEGRRVFVQLHGTVVLASIVYFPLELAGQKLHKL